MKLKPIKVADSGLCLVSDWYSLGAILQVSPSIMAYGLKFRKLMQHKVPHKKRPLYKSTGALKYIQTRIGMLAAAMMDEKEHSNVVLAYRANVNTAAEMANFTGYHTVITTDIRKFYPSIRLEHIEKALQDSGMSANGARLMGRYCIVKGCGLQQGGSSSSAISNLVGYTYIDVPVIEWLKSRDLWDTDKVKYVRYCDNMALFLKDEPDENFYKEFREFLTEELTKSGFKLHKWFCTPRNHRFRAQKFLGIILNVNPRISKDELDRLRAICFNSCRYGLISTAERMLTDVGGMDEVSAHSFLVNNTSIAAEKVKAQLQGKLSYVAQVNATHALWLRKLFHASSQLDEWSRFKNTSSRMELRKSKQLAEVLFSYKKQEDIGTFLERVKDWERMNS